MWKYASWAVLLAGSLWADQIVLKNGDRVTGVIVKKDAKSITIKTDLFGVVTAPWDQVASILADKEINVVLADGKTVAGTLRQTEDKIEISSGGQTLAVPREEVKLMRDAAEQQAYERLLNPSWTRLWAGTGSVGFAGTAGNARTSTFTTGLQAARVTTTDKTTVYFNSVQASALVEGRSAGTAQAVRGGFGYSRNVGSRMFVNTFNDYEYDKFQNLDLRTVFGGGLGYKALRRERMTLDLLGGGAYNYSRFNTPLIRKTGEVYYGNDFTFKINGSTSMFQNFRMFNDMQDFGNYRINFDIGATTKIVKWMTWNVSVSDRYLSNPAPGRKTNDLLYTTGLGISFRR